MSALTDPLFEGLVGAMPSSTFVGVFLSLSPAYFIEPFRTLHRPLHSTTVHVSGYKRLEVIFEEFIHNVTAVAQIRQSAGHKLGLAEYTHILHCASSIGDAILADQAWHNMKEDGVHPDLACYNHLMSAKVWDSAHSGLQRYRLRMTKYVYRKRGYMYPNPGWTGFGTKERSVRKEVVRILNEMMENGFQGDENTFIHVLMSSSRVGNSQGIKRILKAVWNVDVDALLEKAPDIEIEPVTPFPRFSPLYPTKNLLFAVAHSFGNCSDMPAALCAIEHISESYGLIVPAEVWRELLERAFVLSRRRWGLDFEGKDRGQVLPSFLCELYDTMTSEPSNVEPTAHMHSIMAKLAWAERDLPLFKHHLDATYDLLAETRRKQKLARAKVAAYLINTRTSQGPKIRGQFQLTRFKSRPFANAVYEYDLLRLRAAQATMLISRLVRLLIIRKNWDFPGKTELDWERRLIPQILDEWRDFLPDQIHYHTTGGVINRKGPRTWRFRRYTEFDQMPIRHSTAENGLKKREFDPKEIEDDVFWARLLAKYPHFLNSRALHPMNRLFFGVIDRSTVAHPQPHDPFTYEPLADCKTPDDFRAFYRKYDMKAARHYQPEDIQDEEVEAEEEEDPSDAALDGFGYSLV
ncbi:hypothetical protein P170DRAFT_440672 [Aspergillus steynii IBT 23096]|uniref:Uncharacterized protein n=1 Tax=Aspergillus steynii IBT 23096 TaxID=1392250 RepID=A0A2I2FUT7_9EURO|nr:uncharacterized protein P170DRAFT_440672 [Aspergillus steynii IBT 23096]PLB44371.1 hypothetical protein P170DRAFT_440672 [Aspergillus steynii IBT 23096]